jgi:hypothetical protein
MAVKADAPAARTARCPLVPGGNGQFPIPYAFVVMEAGSRPLVEVNVIGSPSATWGLRQFQGVLADEHVHRLVLHDRAARG